MTFDEEIEKLNDDSLWELFSLVEKHLRKRKLIRSRNIVGDRGEEIVVRTYNKIPNEPKLQRALEGTQNLDAISKKGERYAIKAISYPNTTTSAFYGLNDPGSSKPEAKRFEYVVVVTLDDKFQPIEILEADWNTFLRFKKWHSTMKAWNLSVTKSFRQSCRVVFKRNMMTGKE
jgi:hypothetical protein